MDGVADRAGVSKAAIYGWWPSKDALALDALVTDWEATAPRESSRPPGTRAARGDLSPGSDRTVVDGLEQSTIFDAARDLSDVEALAATVPPEQN